MGRTKRRLAETRASLDCLLDEANRTHTAATMLYYAGHWKCDDVPEDEQARLWEQLRVALRLPH